MRKCGGRKQAIGTRTPLAIPQGPNQRWSLELVSDNRFHRDEGLHRACCRLCNGFGTPHIGLLDFFVGAHAERRHPSGLKPRFLKETPGVMGASTGFHRQKAGSNSSGLPRSRCRWTGFRNTAPLPHQLPRGCKPSSANQSQKPRSPPDAPLLRQSRQNFSRSMGRLFFPFGRRLCSRLAKHAELNRA